MRVALPASIDFVCGAELVVNCPSNADESIVVPPTVHIMQAWLAQQLGQAGAAANEDIRTWAAAQDGSLSLTIK